MRLSNRNLSMTDPTPNSAGSTPGESEHPLSSGNSFTAGASHAPHPEANDGLGKQLWVTPVITKREVEPCPFCGKALSLRGGVNPYGVCDTQGCWMNDRALAVVV